MRGSRLAALVLLISSVACGGDGGEGADVNVPVPSGGVDAPAAERVSVHDLRIGTAVEEGRGITQEAVTFQPGDSVFLSAELEGDVDQLNIVIRFTHEDGSVVGGEERFLSLSGKQVVTFDLAPPGGLAAGRYRAELLLGSERVGEKEFTVEG